MYNDTNQYFQLAVKPIGQSKSWGSQVQIFEEGFFESDSQNDCFDLSSSSISPLSFNDSVDIPVENSDSLLLQILDEYSHESFPSFEDFDGQLFVDSYSNSCNVNDFLSFDQDSCNFNRNLCPEDQNLGNCVLFDGEVNLDDYGIPEVNDNEKYFPFTHKSKSIKEYHNSVNQTKSTRKQLDVKTHLDSSERKPFKRKCSDVLLEGDVTEEKSCSKRLQIDLSQELWSESSKRIGNREAAHRYRQKQKFKQTKDAEELGIATREMLKVKNEMFEIRQNMNTMRNLVEELLFQKGYTVHKKM